MTNNLRSDLREAYNKKVRERNGQAVQDWKLAERRQFLELLIHEGKKKLLEIGGGTGKDSLYFQEQGLEVVCTDLSPEMVKLCKQKGLNALVMDFGKPQAAKQSFDAVYALNCLLHLSKEELPKVLKNINAMMKSGGLFYMGVYGGRDFEGIWDEDSYEPKRFFSFYEDEDLKRVVGKVFEIAAFNRIDSGTTDAELHFQSIVLRKKI